MGMLDWAKKEVEIACKKERGDKPEQEWDYGAACYQSALKAYESLCNDGHSGCSWNITSHILSKLMRGHPLTPITDDDFDDENKHYFGDDDDREYMIQCNRMSSLFKEKLKNSDEEYYSDINRSYCQDVEDKRNTYNYGFFEKIALKDFPITMPYKPLLDRFVVVCQHFKCQDNSEDRSDWDTEALFYVTTPSHDNVKINRFWKYTDEGKVEIDKEEFIQRFNKRVIPYYYDGPEMTEEDIRKVIDD